MDLHRVVVKQRAYSEALRENQYTVVRDESFHTEFAARLAGWLHCADSGAQHHHWTLKPPESVTR